jgi:hypothetical protein
MQTGQSSTFLITNRYIALQRLWRNRTARKRHIEEHPGQPQGAISTSRALRAITMKRNMRVKALSQMMKSIDFDKGLMMTESRWL